jgi:hypothetical protein
MTPRTVSRCSVRDGTEERAVVWDDGDTLATCARCGGDRLIPLSFSDPEPDDGGQPDVDGQRERTDPPDRPIMKCLTCGARLHAGDVVRS